jgi:hypothetical protein
MPYRAASKVKGLYKKHNERCRNAAGDPTDCDCPWYGKYMGISKGLAAWARKEVNPRTKAGAEAVLRRFKITRNTRPKGRSSHSVLASVSATSSWSGRPTTPRNTASHRIRSIRC